MSKLVRLDNLFDGIKTVSDIVDKLKMCEQPDIRHEHRFTGGLYCRTFFPKENTFVVGKIHRFAGVNMLLSGAVTIYDGEKTQHYTAPHTFISKGNNQKVGFFTKDSEFAFVSTCFANNVEDAEKELFYHDDTAIEQVKDWEHYADMLVLTGMTEDVVQALVNRDNLIEGKVENFKIGKSKIHGLGFFTTISYCKGDLIGDGFIDGNRTELGRWVNDSCVPNAHYIPSDKYNGTVLALRDIAKGEEITFSYINNLTRQKEIL